MPRQDTAIEQRISKLESIVSTFQYAILPISAIFPIVARPIFEPPSRRGAKGFFSKTFARIYFAPGEWTKAGPDANGCDTYTAKKDGAVVGVDDILGKREDLKAKKDLKVKICQSTAHFDEGFTED